MVIPSMNVLKKLAIGLGAVTLFSGATLHRKRQYDFVNAPWFQEAMVKLKEHEGVRVLIGPPPLSVGDVARFTPDIYTPSVPIDPAPVYVLRVPVEGKVGKGNLLLWLNYHVPIEVVRKDINSWNVALIEMQIGTRKENKFVLK